MNLTDPTGLWWKQVWNALKFGTKVADTGGDIISGVDTAARAKEGKLYSEDYGNLIADIIIPIPGVPLPSTAASLRDDMRGLRSDVKAYNSEMRSAHARLFMGGGDYSPIRWELSNLERKLEGSLRDLAETAKAARGMVVELDRALQRGTKTIYSSSHGRDNITVRYSTSEIAEMTEKRAFLQSEIAQSEQLLTEITGAGLDQ